MRDLRVSEILVKSALNRSGLPEYDYVLNPYSGCFHGCIYCFAPDFTRESEARERWGSTVFVKANLLEVLKREISSKMRGLVGISSVTDPYHFIEGKYRLVREGLKLLLANGFRISIQTKSPLVLRDMDLLARYRKSLDVGFTITALDRNLAEILEPYAPEPSSRAAAVRKLSEAGIKTWIFLGPIIGGINDSHAGILPVLELAAETSSRVIYDWYTPYRGSTRMMASSSGVKDGGRLVPSAALKAELRGWLFEKAAELGVEINSQEDEWLRKPETGKLF